MTQSWVIVNKETGAAVFETWNKKTADAINKEKYEAKPIANYLGDLNQRIKNDPTRH